MPGPDVRSESSDEMSRLAELVITVRALASGELKTDEVDSAIWSLISELPAKATWRPTLYQGAMASMESAHESEQEYMGRLESLVGDDSADGNEVAEIYFEGLLRTGGFSMAAVILSAATLEAFIFEYASDWRSPSWVDKYLYGLNFVSRWVVIPELATGKRVVTSAAAHKELRWLHTARNRLVHAKPKQLKASDITSDLWVKVDDANRAVATVGVVVKALQDLDSAVDTSWL